MPDSLKKLFWPGAAEAGEADPPRPGRKDAPSAPAVRRSNGLREFCHSLKGLEGLRVLDLGTACQANLDFFLEQRHKIYTEDLLTALDANVYRVRGENGLRSFDTEGFLAENLSYQMLLFDAVLCWDLFDHVEEHAIRSLVDRLHWVVKPGGILLAFFHIADPGAMVPAYQYRIQGPDLLELHPRGQAALRRPLNNRNIENLFRTFHSLKFFLARDNLREVLIVR